MLQWFFLTNMEISYRNLHSLFCIWHYGLCYCGVILSQTAWDVKQCSQLKFIKLFDWFQVLWCDLWNCSIIVWLKLYLSKQVKSQQLLVLFSNLSFTGRFCFSLHFAYTACLILFEYVYWLELFFNEVFFPGCPKILALCSFTLLD